MRKTNKSYMAKKLESVCAEVPTLPKVLKQPDNIALVKSRNEISPLDPPPLDGTVMVLHTPNIMIITFCFYARILEDYYSNYYSNLTVDADTHV